jgi:ABC-type Fe3+ transport system permease subunit
VISYMNALSLLFVFTITAFVLGFFVAALTDPRDFEVKDDSSADEKEA